MKKTFVDLCIERAEKARLSSDDHGHNTDVLREYCENELIYAYDVMVPELARRLKKAIEILTTLHNKDPFFAFLSADIKELEAPEEK